MILLKVLMMLCMRLLLMSILMLEIVHHGHTLPARRTVDSAMLSLLVALTEHSVEALTG
jgi:hypothetical protein